MKSSLLKSEKFTFESESSLLKLNGMAGHLVPAERAGSRGLEEGHEEGDSRGDGLCRDDRGAVVTPSLV